MPYLPLVIVVATGSVVVGLVLVVAALMGLVRRARRLQTTFGSTRVALGDRAGLLRARSAALRVALADRRRQPGE